MATVMYTLHAPELRSTPGNPPGSVGQPLEAAEGLREATAKEEAKNESKTGHDLAKGADRFEERSKSSDGKSAQEKQKG